MPREHSPRRERATRELRHAVRVLRRSPGFAIAAVLILGLGIGMATATFTVFDALAVRPLPAREPERVVTLNTLDETGADVSLTQAEIAQVVAASRTITGAAGVAHQGAFATSVRDGDRFITLRGAWVTGNFFDVLGAKPALGRFFDATEESRTGIGAPIVLSWEAWRTAFGGDSSVVGRSLGNPYTADQALVVGVAPPGLAFPAGVEYWAPNIYPNLDVVARLAPGATVDAAR
ncbi:MAG: ABC transporter permease, partial [Gemmatimonadaceae bacterium]